MVQPSQDIVTNRLLRALAPHDYALLQPHLSAVTLERDQILVKPNEPITQVWFLTSGLASIIAMSTETQSVEVGLAGREGMLGTSLLLDSDRTPHRVFMQVGGRGFCLSADALQRATDTSPTLRRTLLRYVQVFAVYTAYTALSNAVHMIEQRLARWLLMSHDRQDRDELPLTHDFMALMLGVRRPTVTIALHSLEGLGFIKATRGQVTIRNRADLEEFAGAAYGIPEAEYARLIGPLR